MAKVRQVKKPSVAAHPSAASGPSAPRALTAVVLALAHEVRKRMGHDSGMWFLFFGVTHLVFALFLMSQAAAFKGALASPPVFGETKPEMMHALETAQQAGAHPVAPLVAYPYLGATLALWAVLVATRRRWRGRQLRIMGLLLVPGTFMALYVVGHLLLL